MAVDPVRIHRPAISSLERNRTRKNGYLLSLETFRR